MRKLLSRADDVLRGPSPATTVGVPRLVGVTVVFGAFYGAVMGSWGGLEGDRAWQVVISATKVPLLLLATFALALPSFFVLNTLAGVRDDFVTVVRGLAATQAGMTVVLAALAPVTMLWYASVANYQLAILFNGVMFAVATLAAQLILRRWYRPLIARNRVHRTLLIAWAIAYSFVAVQMAWVLRPFIGLPDAPVQFFRAQAWDNAYVIVAQMIRRALFR